MSWLRANWLNLVVVLAVVGTISGWVNAARWEGVAEVHAAQADSARASAERTAQANVVLTRTVARQDSTYTADSLAWSEREAHNRAQIAELSRSARRTADALRERLDSVGTRLLAEYEAQVDSIMQVKDEQIDNLEAERASLWQQRETLGELVAGLRRENADWKATAASLTEANAALRRANQAGGLFPDLGVFTEPAVALIGGGIGYLLGRAAG